MMRSVRFGAGHSSVLPLFPDDNMALAIAMKLGCFVTPAGVVTVQSVSPRKVATRALKSDSVLRDTQVSLELLLDLLPSGLIDLREAVAQSNCLVQLDTDPT